MTYLMDTYRRLPITAVTGKGVWLIGVDGREYLDCLGGLGCCALGHADDRVADAISRQAATLVQPSNFFTNPPAEELAGRLRRLAGGWGQVFLTNSGAEANEAAIKLVRKWAGPSRYKIVCAKQSFHGRTLGALAATGQPAKWSGFEPLPKGFVHALFNDIDAFAAAVDDSTAAIMVEPIQGEAGVIPATREFLHGLRTLADERGVALVFDEVQTGVGRTGHWWAYQTYETCPDVFCSAKALANGVPIGAVVAVDRIAASFARGDHGTTFGGNPLAAAAANATLEALEADGIIASVTEKGEYLQRALGDVEHVTHARGIGLMQAAVLDAPIASDVAAAALQAGLIVNAAAPDTLRFLPPLIISYAELDCAVSILQSAISAISAASS